jgi:hypothetical protein
MGNSSLLVVYWKVSFDMIDGMIDNVVYVHNCLANFISIYHIENSS